MTDNSVKYVTVKMFDKMLPHFVLYYQARHSLLSIFSLFLSRNFIGEKKGKMGGKNQKIEMKKKIFFCCLEDIPSPRAGERKRGGSEHAGPRVGYILHQRSPCIGQQSMLTGPSLFRSLIPLFIDAIFEPSAQFNFSSFCLSTLQSV